MRAASRTSWDWLQIASLGEQLRSEDSLTAQRDRIAEVAKHLISGKAEVWLQENIFRLPNWDAEHAFSTHPTLDGMKRAIETGKLVQKERGKKENQRLTLHLCCGAARRSGNYAGSASDHPHQGTRIYR